MSTEQAPAPVQEQAPQQEQEPWMEDAPAEGQSEPESQPDQPAQTDASEPETPPEQSELEQLRAQNAQMLALLAKLAPQQQAPVALSRTKALITQRFNDASGQNLADVLDALRAELREEMGRDFAPLEHLKRTEHMVLNVAVGEEERRVQSMLAGEGVQKPVLAKAQATVAEWIKQGKTFPDAETAYRAAVQKQEAAARQAQAARAAAGQQAKQQRQQQAGFPANRGTGNRAAYGDLESRAMGMDTAELMKELERIVG